mmetsp:Transcript_117505/g.339716  ORF Transcript_117505/g.339716 Transcript_117505/m.339716 type:complete len:528 (-) Transcript_117505:3954-5537(-)
MAHALEHAARAEQQQEPKFPHPRKLEGRHAELVVQVRRLQESEGGERDQEHRGKAAQNGLLASSELGAFERPLPLFPDGHDETGADREFGDVANRAAHETVEDEEVVRGRDKANNDRRGDGARIHERQNEEHQACNACRRHQAVRREIPREARPTDQGEGLRHRIDQEVAHRGPAEERRRQGRHKGSRDVAHADDPIDNRRAQCPAAEPTSKSNGLLGDLELPLDLLQQLAGVLNGIARLELGLHQGLDLCVCDLLVQELVLFFRARLELWRSRLDLDHGDCGGAAAGGGPVRVHVGAVRAQLASRGARHEAGDGRPVCDLLAPGGVLRIADAGGPVAVQSAPRGEHGAAAAEPRTAVHGPRGKDTGAIAGERRPVAVQGDAWSVAAPARRRPILKGFQRRQRRHCWEHVSALDVGVVGRLLARLIQAAARGRCAHEVLRADLLEECRRCAAHSLPIELLQDFRVDAHKLLLPTLHGEARAPGDDGHLVEHRPLASHGLADRLHELPLHVCGGVRVQDLEVEPGQLT